LYGIDALIAVMVIAERLMASSTSRVLSCPRRRISPPRQSA
jgi:hypothetical protein